MVEAVTAALLLVSCVVALAIILEKFVLKLWWFGGKCIELLLKLPPPVSFTVSAVRFTVTAVRFTVTAVRFTVTAALHLVSCVVALQAPLKNLEDLQVLLQKAISRSHSLLLYHSHQAFDLAATFQLQNQKRNQTAQTQKDGQCLPLGECTLGW